MKHHYILKTITISFILFIYFQNTADGQQLPQYTSISINPYLVNPAVAGTEDFIHLQGGYRNQWTNFEDAPQTIYFSGHTALNQSNANFPLKAHASRTSIGLNLIQDQTGPISQSKVAASFAYNFALSSNSWRLSIGANAGIQGFSYRPEGYTDHLLHQDDLTIMTPISKDFLSVAGGFWLYNDHLFLGGSSFQLFNTEYGGLGNISEFVPASALTRHYFYMAGAKASLGIDAYLVPSLLIKHTPGAPLSFDFNTKLVISDKYWLGGSYRKEDSLSAFGGLLINSRFEITYAFDLTLSKIRTVATGSNEIHLGYRLFRRSEVVCPSKFW